MHKMKLDLDALVVESFDTSARGAGAGTVRGHSDDGAVVGPDPIIISWNGTCPESCGDTCYVSCISMCSCPTRRCDTCV